MTRELILALIATAAVTSCRVETPPYGGEPETKLVTATNTADIEAIKTLLASGANPNKMVKFEGDYESAWFIALEQLRPKRPETIEIIKVLLKAKANPNEAWGTDRKLVKVQESFWKKLTSGGRGPGTGSENPLRLAMFHPVPEVVRALVDAGIDRALCQDALVNAVETEEIEIVHILVEAGVDVNCHPGANTPLTAAIEARNVELMTYLEEHGAREKP